MIFIATNIIVILIIILNIIVYFLSHIKYLILNWHRHYHLLTKCIKIANNVLTFVKKSCCALLMLEYRECNGNHFFVLPNVRAAINEKLLEAEVPVRVVHFSASVRAIFFRVEERLGKNAFAFTSFFRFCSFVVTSFVNHVIPSVYVLIINVHAVMHDFLDYNVKI